MSERENADRQSLRKHVYILVGPKGSGKSYIGCVLEKHYGITFLPVERLLLDHVRQNRLPASPLNKDGFDIEEEAIHRILERESAVISEATGSSSHLQGFLENLGGLYDLKLIRIHCPLDICFSRVKGRKTKDHFRVTDEQLRRINKESASIEFDWDLEIDNSGPASNQDIISQFESIM